ncbi:MAG: toxin-activating lysine-acyltransferase [Betaproteobacteria bacterium AqS2]|uniref:RTX toxin-activating lysine-acyltransferase n=1 Tax=Candidatus Amphirhobacter heronislandensis TaxID=1732024 RepID=A0A930Y3L9_9GAMM|nr:toxin-activating lysine-acyltransferase [Betaproteobacteria bacterium AqS2]
MPEKTEASKKDREAASLIHRAVGEIALFLGQHDGWRFDFLSDLHWRVLPPVALRQYKLVQGPGGGTVGYISWARVGEEVERRLLVGERRIKPSEWNSGAKAVVMDLACPESARQRILGGIQVEVFSDAEELYVIERNKEGAIELRLVEPWREEEKKG